MTVVEPVGRTQPGVGAREQYERRRAARERRAPGSEPSAPELAWLKGADGERRFGEQLEDAAACMGGVAVLHDLVAPGKKANIDHVVVGPTGVTVIDAKTWSGRIKAGDGVVLRAGRRDSQSVEGTRKQLHAISAALAVAGRDDVVVAGAISFVEDNEGLDRNHLHDAGGVPIGCCAPVIRWAMRDGHHDILDVGSIVALLSRSFVVRGGSAPAVDRQVGPTTIEEAVRILPATQTTTKAPRPVPLPGLLEAGMSAAPGTLAGTAAPARARSRSAKRRPAPRQTSRRSVKSYRSGTARRRRELAWSVFTLVVALALLASLPSLFTSVVERGQRAATPSLSRAQLNDASPRLRGLARRLADGNVSGPRVLSRPDEFVLTYRRGAVCLVRLRVPRDRGTAGLTNVAARVRRCES